MAQDTRGDTSLIQGVGTPALFVVLWSTGFIGARLGLPHAGPLTFLYLRYALAAGLLMLVSLASRAPWPRQLTEIRHFAVAGLLVHDVYLGGVFLGLSMGVEAGVSAVIVGLQPLLTAALAGVLLGERVTPRQWLGFALGMSGVTLVLAGKMGQAPGSLLGSIACVAALIGITVGTLYQKRFCAGMDLRTGSVVQFVAAGLATAPWLSGSRICMSNGTRSLPSHCSGSFSCFRSELYRCSTSLSGAAPRPKSSASSSSSRHARR